MTALIRVCVPCDLVRWAPCCSTCRVPDGGQADSWVVNVRDDAGEMTEEEAA